MNKLDKLFLRMAQMSPWAMRRKALDGQPDERRVARLCQIMDFAGQKREKNGQFGTGKKPGSGESSGRQNGGAGKASSAPSATGANKLARGFTPSRAKEHEKHRKAQYPDLSPKQYEQRGVDLCEQKVGGDIDGFLDNAGNIVRYRNSTNELAIGHPQNGLITLYKPKKDTETGYAYFKKIKSSAEKSEQKGKKR